jgi:hypothetical protein
MKVKAKFRCKSVTDFGQQKKMEMSAVYGTSGENADFTSLTPAGELSIYIQSDAPASLFFEPQKDYYLTFEAAE